MNKSKPSCLLGGILGTFSNQRAEKNMPTVPAFFRILWTNEQTRKCMLACRCVTPHIVVPSAKKWSQADLEYHAKVAVASCVLNSGHNCLSTELIVTAKGWPQREEFLEALRKVLNGMSQRWPWYPGSMVRIHTLLFSSPLLSAGCCI